MKNKETLEDLNHTKLNSKNIFLVPTDNPSRIFEFGGSYHLCDKEQENFRSFNIYITSDEIIKDDCYQLNTLTNKVCKNNGFITDITDKKIILTTDPDLIECGVQAIDDDFLKWFVKNPSYEKLIFSTYHVKGDISGKLHYKIVIPSSEHKQFNSEDFGLPQLGTKEFNDLASSYFGCKPNEEPKQECNHEIVVKYGVAECQNCGIEEIEIIKDKKELKPSEIVIKSFDEEYIKIDLYDSNNNFIGKLDRNQYIDVRIQAYMKNIKGLYVVYPNGEKGFINHENGTVSYFQEGLWDTASRLSHQLVSLMTNDIKNQNRIIE